MEGLSQLAVLAAAGVVGGLALLVRGMLGHGSAARLSDTATSRISSLAIGEVRVSGVAEPAATTLVSPLQSAACLYYRARVGDSDGESSHIVLDEERAVGFRVRDETGSVRVFPRDASWDVPWTWEDATGPLGEQPPGLRERTGPAFGPVGPHGEPDREEQIAALLTVRPAGDGLDEGGGGDRWSFGPGLSGIGGSNRRRRTYAEARIEPGQVVTVVGHVQPFDQLDDPLAADVGGSARLHAAGDPEIAADLADARAAGILAATPEEAWGNAAIPGFGIGAPARLPDLDPAARPLPLAPAEDLERATAAFHIAPGDLVLAAAPDAPLLVALGPPAAAVARHEQRFLVGLLGAVVAIGSAIVLALAVGGGLGS
jgi:hypothetical protein